VPDGSRAPRLWRNWEKVRKRRRDATEGVSMGALRGGGRREDGRRDLHAYL